jgi:hypothetical protein
MDETPPPLEGQNPDATNFRDHIERTVFWIWAIIIAQVTFTVIALSLIIPLVASQLQGVAFSRTIFTIFATVYSQVSWAYIFLFSFGTIENDKTRRLSWLFVGFLNLLFYFSAAIAMTTLSLGSECSDQNFIAENPLFEGSESRCRIGQTCVAFLWLGMSGMSAI